MNKVDTFLDTFGIREQSKSMGLIIEQLKEFGLEEKESRVYLASLKSGEMTIAELSRKAGIKRPTMYYVIESLIDKGLVVKIPKGRRIFYRAEPPKQLSSIVRRKDELLRHMLPVLESEYRTNRKMPSITFHEGKEAIYTMYEKLFSTSKTVYTIISIEDFLSVFSESENRRLFELLKQQGGYLYDMFQWTTRAKEVKQRFYRKGVSRTKILPEFFKSPVDMTVAGNTVVLISFRSLIAVVIEDEAIATAQRSLLQFLWKFAK